MRSNSPSPLTNAALRSEVRPMILRRSRLAFAARRNAMPEASLLDALDTTVTSASKKPYSRR